MHPKRECDQQPRPGLPPKKQACYDREDQERAEVVEQDVVVAVIGVAAPKERQPVEVACRGGQGDGSALAPVELSPVREPPAVLQVTNRTQERSRN